MKKAKSVDGFITEILPHPGNQDCPIYFFNARQPFTVHKVRQNSDGWKYPYCNKKWVTNGQTDLPTDRQTHPLQLVRDDCDRVDEIIKA